MPLQFVLDGTDLGTSVVRLGGVEGFICEAEEGTTGMCTVSFDDPAGSLVVTGWRKFYAGELAGPIGQQRLFTGYVGIRRYMRSQNNESLITGASRRIECDLVDINAILSFRLFPPSDTNANRGSETDVARLQWLLSTSYLSPTVTNYGFVNTTGGITLDAADYRGQSPMSLVSDCANASGKNYYLYYDETNVGVGIWYDFDYSPNFTCPLRLSNVLSDVGTNASTSYQSAVLATAPISYWRLDEASGTVAYDVMGANNGTYVNAPTLGVAGLLTGDPDTAVTFAGATQKVTSAPPVNAAGLNPFSLGVWLSHVPDGTYQNILLLADGAGWPSYLYSSNGGPGFQRQTPSGLETAAYGTPLSSSVRHMLVGTFDGTTLRLYVDGVALGSTPTTVRAAGASTTFTIGSPSTAAATIDEPAIWNRALSATEVAALYAAGTTAPTTYAYNEDAELTRDPSRVYSGVQVPYSGTSSPVYVQDLVTSSAYVSRDTTAPNANAKTSGQATAQANTYLAAAETEADSLTLTVRLPAAVTPLVRAGMRIAVRASHLPDLTSFTYVRIMHVEYKQIEMTPDFYDVLLTMTPPGGAIVKKSLYQPSWNFNNLGVGAPGRPGITIGLPATGLDYNADIRVGGSGGTLIGTYPDTTASGSSTAGDGTGIDDYSDGGPTTFYNGTIYEIWAAVNVTYGGLGYSNGLTYLIGGSGFPFPVGTIVTQIPTGAVGPIAAGTRFLLGKFTISIP